MASNKQQGKQQKLTAKQKGERVRAAQEREARAKEQREKAERTKKIFTIVVCVILVLALGIPTMALAVLGACVGRDGGLPSAAYVASARGMTTSRTAVRTCCASVAAPFVFAAQPFAAGRRNSRLRALPYRVNVCACTTGSFAEQFVLL